MANTEDTKKPDSEPDELTPCGIVMPISDMHGYSASHWDEVLKIIKESLKEVGFDADLVSNADEVGIIQERIVRHLAEDSIVVCDVSGKNPNVMFELGLRLAFDKPTVVIKDERTGYSFDTSSLEHLGYPSDLNYHKIQDFKDKLAAKVKSTHKKGVEDPAYSPFLRSFVQLRPKHLPTKEVELPQVLLDELKALRSEISSLRPRSGSPQEFVSTRPNDIVYGLLNKPTDWDEFLGELLRSELPFRNASRINSTIHELVSGKLSELQVAILQGLCRKYGMELTIKVGQGVYKEL